MELLQIISIVFSLKLRIEYEVKMKYLYTLSICAALAATNVSAGSTISTNITVEDLTISGLGSVASTYTTSLQYNTIMDNDLALMGGFRYSTGDVLGVTLTGTSLSGGLGYAISNDFDIDTGVGSDLVVGAMFSNTNLKVDNIDESSSDTHLGIVGQTALGKGFAVNYAASAPFDDFGNTISYNFGVSFGTGLGEMKIGMVGGSSKVNSVDISTTGWTVGFISRF